MKLEDRDLLAVDAGVVVHQVNCRGVMGAGIALQIRRAFPRAYTSYRQHYKRLRPGMIQLVKIKPGLWVCNLAGQDGYGHDKQYTDYAAIRAGLEKLSAWLADHDNPQTYFPFKMGCNLAGGDWSKVYALIDELLPTAIICKPKGI